MHYTQKYKQNAYRIKRKCDFNMAITVKLVFCNYRLKFVICISKVQKQGKQLESKL